MPALAKRAGLLSVLPGAALAVDISVALEDVIGPDWRMAAVSIQLHSPQAGDADLKLRVGEAVLPDGQGTLHGVELACPGLHQADSAWHCEHGELRVSGSPIGPQSAIWQGSYSAEGGWRIDIRELDLARGRAALSFHSAKGDWSGDLQVLRLQARPLAKVLGMPELPQDWAIKGLLSGTFRLGGDDGGLTRLSSELVIDRLNYASPDGRHAAEDVVLRLDASARRRGDNWNFTTDLRWPKGAAYAEPVFLQPAGGGTTATARGAWDGLRNLVQFDSWSLQQPGVVDLSGTGRLDTTAGTFDDLTIVARSDHAGALYDTLLQPFLITTAADDLDVRGRLGLVVHFDAKGIEQAGLELSGLSLTDRQGRFSLDSTDGSIAWDRERLVPVSRLAAQGASVYQIATGGFSIEALFSGDGVRLQKPVEVALSGGRFRLENFELSGALVAGAQPSWQADASVHDVSLAQLTTALDWPPFEGSLDGTLRDMRYSDQVFVVGGGLQIEAFDGSAVVNNLEIREPFGTVPVLSADARLRGLDLHELTQTFSFGRIEGRLDGEIDAIRLSGWRPDSFDLHLYSPEQDDLRHRISQRAVENLTELGNGVSAGLSTTFLRIFDEFRYDRIDLKVLLRGDTAEMGGIARSDGGYYLVKGAGLPRIDVIGRNRRIAWKDLVERLRRIQVEQARIQ
jgi:hypothetical protein